MSSSTCWSLSVVIESGTSELYTNFLLGSHATARTRKDNRERKQSRKPSRLSLRLCAFAWVILSGIMCAHANVRDVVTISVTMPDGIKVQAELSTPMRSWSFRNAYAGVLGIAERVQNFQAVDAVVEKAATGEFRSDRTARRISYTLKLPKPTLADVTHFTWIAS